MIIASNWSWCLVTPPKTASTTLIALLPKLTSAFYTGYQHDCRAFADGCLYVSVRSPWTRSVSLWRHKVGELHGQCHLYPFTEFMREVIAGRLTDFFSFTMCDWLAGEPFHGLIRLENLASGLQQLVPGYTGDVPTLNTSHVNLGTWSMADEDRRLVLRWAAEDFAKFGYETDYNQT